MGCEYWDISFEFDVKTADFYKKEKFRKAIQEDFSQPPHRGRLNYQDFNPFVTYEEVQEKFNQFLAKMNHS